VWPVLFTVRILGHELPVRSFGLFVMVGFLVGMWWGTRLSRRYGSDPEHDHERIPDLAWWVLLGVIGGGRLAYVLVNPGDFVHAPWEILAIWKGGLVMYGGLILALVLGAWKVRRLGMDPWMTADYGLTAGFLGQAIGRWGCLAVGDDYGAPTSVPWAIRVPNPLPEGSLFPPVLAGLRVHPTQLYMSLAALALFLLGSWLLRHRRFRGQVCALLLAGYAVLRFVIECYRWDAEARSGIWKPGHGPAEVQRHLQELGIVDAAGRVLDLEAWRELLHQGAELAHPQLLLSTSQIVSLVLLPAALVFYLWLRRRPGAALPAA